MAARSGAPGGDRRLLSVVVARARRGDLIGYTGLNRAEVEDEPVLEVGWSIAPERWGEGLATEAARAAVAWGFDRAELEEIVSFTLVDNARSQRVMERLGMERVREFERRGLPHVLYRLAVDGPALTGARTRKRRAARGGRASR